MPVVSFMDFILHDHSTGYAVCCCLLLLCCLSIWCTFLCMLYIFFLVWCWVNLGMFISVAKAMCCFSEICCSEIFVLYWTDIWFSVKVLFYSCCYSIHIWNFHFLHTPTYWFLSTCMCYFRYSKATFSVLWHYYIWNCFKLMFYFLHTSNQDSVIMEHAWIRCPLFLTGILLLHTLTVTWHAEVTTVIVHGSFTCYKDMNCLSQSLCGNRCVISK